MGKIGHGLHLDVPNSSRSGSRQDFRGFLVPNEFLDEFRYLKTISPDIRSGLPQGRTVKTSASARDLGNFRNINLFYRKHVLRFVRVAGITRTRRTMIWPVFDTLGLAGG